MHFALEIIEAMCEAVGPDMIVSIHLSGDKFVPGGLALADVVEVSCRLAETHLLHYLPISQCNYTASFLTRIPDESYTEGAFVYFVAAIKEATPDIPILAVSRIKHPEHAEQILGGKLADAVIMTRALITDPEPSNKLLEGRRDDIRGCISCNQGCVSMVHADRPTTCLQNPVAGYEQEWGIVTLKPVTEPKRVVIVGDAPAEMEAAIVTAAQGHHVIPLLGQEVRVGGRINLVCQFPKRCRFAEVIRWRLHARAAGSQCLAEHRAKRVSPSANCESRLYGREHADRAVSSGHRSPPESRDAEGVPRPVATSGRMEWSSRRRWYDGTHLG